MTSHVRLLAEEVDGRADRFSGGDLERHDFDLGVAERHPRLDLPRESGGGVLRRSLGVRRFHLEAEGPALADAAVGDEARVRLVGGVDGEDAEALGGGRRGVAADDGVADGHRLADVDERVEHVRAPLDAVANDQFRLRVDASSEPVENADAVRQPRLSSDHHARL